MRRYNPTQDIARHPRMPLGRFHAIERTSLFSPTWFVSADGTRVQATCMNCPDEWCVRFLPHERPIGFTREKVCPVDAIAFVDPTHTELQISPACVGCGLCVARCPYGGLYLDAEGRPALGFVEPGDYRQVPADQFVDGRFFELVATDAAQERDVQALTEALIEEAKDSFYALIASLFTAVGLPSSAGSIGDTSNRIDAHIYDRVHSLPIEIKSPREERGVISVKAVQQALENKVILQTRQRDTYPSRDESSSLVVGYSYPAVRSDVLELVQDIAEAYGINIGLLVLRDLYDWLWEKYVLRQDREFQIIWTLRGPYRA
jgi:ferredoxin